MDICVVILTKDEKLHIGRCLDRIAALSPRQVCVVDCFSTDGTQRIVEEWKSGGVGEWRSGGVGTAAEFRRRALEKVEETPRLMPLAEAVETVVHRQVAAGSNPSTQGSISNAALGRKGGGNGVFLVEHEWPGNQAAQFQWALDNLPIETKWILRLDADEYLTNELISEISDKLPQMDDDVDGVVLKRRHVVGWLGNRWIKRGMYPTKILRLFRKGHGRSDMKIMDEHIVVQRRVVELEHDFVDHSLISFEEWKEKHRNYAKREAQSYLSGERSTGEKAAKKDAYYKLPRYFRAVAYFCIRYFLKLGFLDGVAGFRWHFWQGLWYRWIVDREIAYHKRILKQPKKELV